MICVGPDALCTHCPCQYRSMLLHVFLQCIWGIGQQGNKFDNNKHTFAMSRWCCYLVIRVWVKELVRIVGSFALLAQGSGRERWMGLGRGVIRAGGRLMGHAVSSPQCTRFGCLVWAKLRCSHVLGVSKPGWWNSCPFWSNGYVFVGSGIHFGGRMYTKRVRFTGIKFTSALLIRPQA